MFLFLSFILAFNINAKKFSNSYLEFDIPDDWHCKAEGGQYVCQPINPEKRKEAIVVMASKYQGPEDTLKKYEERLNKNKKIKDLKGKDYSNTIKYTKYTPIEAVPWVDSLHQDSEVPGFLTRYLATIYEGVGIAITFSAHTSKYDQYKPTFFQMVKTLRIRKDIPKPERLSGTHSSSSALDLGFNLDSLSEKPQTKADSKAKGTISLGNDIEKAKDNSNMKIILIILAVLVLLVILRRLRKK